MSATGFFQWLNDSSMGTTIRESLWLFPIFEIIHVAAIVFVVGSIARLDLRLAGLIERDRPITEVSKQLLPWTWTAFVLATIFGLLLFTAKPFVYLEMPFFDVKIGLIVLAGINMLVFEVITFRSIAAWDRTSLPPGRVRMAAGLSLAFWISVVVCGRLIGFV